MKKTINVLVTGVGGDVAQGIIKALKATNLSVKLFTTDIDSNSAWLYREGTGFLVPPYTDDRYLDTLSGIIERYKIDVMFPGVDGEIAKIADYYESMRQRTGVHIFVDTPQKVSICNDKMETIHFLEQGGYSFPKTCLANSPQLLKFIVEVGFPVIFKPRSGKGGAGLQVITNIGQLVQAPITDKYVAQESIDSACGEYTAGVYIGDDGEVKGSCVLRRILKNGSTVVGERIVDRDIEGQVTSIALRLGMKYVNIQFRMRDSTILPFEFNGRLSGSTAMVARVFNAPELFIRERVFGEQIDRQKSDETFVAMRTYEETFIHPSRVGDVIDLRIAR